MNLTDRLVGLERGGSIGVVVKVDFGGALKGNGRRRVQGNVPKTFIIGELNLESSIPIVATEN